MKRKKLRIKKNKQNNPLGLTDPPFVKKRSNRTKKRNVRTKKIRENKNLTPSPRLEEDRKLYSN
jgi:hypothetical protein